MPATSTCTLAMFLPRKFISAGAGADVCTIMYTCVFFNIEKYQFSQPNHRENHGKQQITRASSVHQPPELQNATPHFNVSCLDDYLCSFALVILVQPPAPGMVKREPL